tara:strand:- start:2597 stop:2836 length:240 start_codon:yes stop_codon:yes gene_type:complete
MNNQIITSGIVSILFFIIKFIEMRFIIKENKPVKNLVIDSLIVFISVVLTLLLLDQFNLNELIGGTKISPAAFVNNPDF